VVFDIEPGEGQGRLRLIGELDLATYESLLEAARGQMGGPDGLTLDMSGLTFMDSKGLRAILILHRELGGRPIRLVAPSRTVLRVLEVSGVIHLEGLEITEREP